MYFLVVVYLFYWLLPVYAQAQDDLLLTTPPIIASAHIFNTPVLWKGREWQRSGNGKRYTWEGAKTYCQDLELGGHSDWSLPTKDELKGLVYCSNGTIILYDYPRDPWNCEYGGDNYVSPTIDDSFSCYREGYWSSTPGGTDTAWHVNFKRGGCGGAYRSAFYYARCVR